MHFQVPNNKGHNFLKLLNDDSNLIKLSVSKDGPWLNCFGYYNLLWARATRVIVNHALIGGYCLRFFPQEEFKCPCGLYPIESRHHILYECKHYNNCWNLKSDSIAHSFWSLMVMLFSLEKVLLSHITI